MKIAVNGTRAGSSDWEAVRNLPKESLPSLTPGQIEVARKLGASEEDYARSVLAGEKTTERLLAKTEQLARLLQRWLRAKAPDATVEHVTLDVWGSRFDVVLEAADHAIPVHIAEDIVDELFERGAEDAERRLSRILEMALGARVA